MLLWAGIFFEESEGHIILRAMPLMLFVLVCLAVAYRYYSAFLAAKVAALDDSRVTPAHLHNDGQNYHPTSKWVLFGHHFAAISGAGPLIGPVLAIQYGYMPGLLWLVIGVCLAGAVQDMLVLAASVRRGGKSLAQIALTELGKPAAIIVSVAILFIVVIALAGLGFVVVKALGGEEIPLAEGTRIELPDGGSPEIVHASAAGSLYRLPKGCRVIYPKSAGHAKQVESFRPESFQVEVPAVKPLAVVDQSVSLPAGTQQVVPGSSWGTFTIACTIPIALFVGWYMYRFRRGKVVEASVIGAMAVLAAVVLGNWVPGSPLEGIFSLSKEGTVLALTLYGFAASVLPVWMLLLPRDYLSSFLKIGTIALLVVGVLLANPVLPSPMVNHVFINGGPTLNGNIFPFVFICIMCGAISGFHSLVSSGTTPKMVDRESHVRPIGYGAMLMEGLVGVVALIAAASLDPQLYYDINVSQVEVPAWQDKLKTLYQEFSNVTDLEHLNLATVEEKMGGESLRGRTGGAVTLAVGMSLILTKPLDRLGLPADDLMKYWYHFAIMFEALFILTTIDAGTRIARFLLQEALGRMIPRFEKTDWVPGSILATATVTGAWGYLVYTGSINTIWPMFGIANQLLAVIALCLITTMMINAGRGRYAPVALLPMLFVTTTTMTAGYLMAEQFVDMARRGQEARGVLNLLLTLFLVVSVSLLLVLASSRWLAVISGMVQLRKEES
jgi:carbon starvation protein